VKELTENSGMPSRKQWNDWQKAVICLAYSDGVPSRKDNDGYSANIRKGKFGAQDVLLLLEYLTLYGQDNDHLILLTAL
jgi:hypothetical protein